MVVFEGCFGCLGMGEICSFLAFGIKGWYEVLARPVWRLFWGAKMSVTFLYGQKIRVLIAITSTHTWGQSGDKVGTTVKHYSTNYLLTVC